MQSDDLVKRLQARCSYGDARLWQKHDPLSEKAAARITELQAEVERLRAQVERVTSDREYIIGFNAGWSEAVARIGGADG